MSDAAVERLVMVIVNAQDGERLMQRLIADGLPATKIGSSGGFLRRGQATVLSGVTAADVSRVLAAVEATCPRRTEFSPAQALPLPVTGNQSVEVRTGGAVVFVVPVERFERI